MENTDTGIFLLSIANGLLTWSLQYISSGLAAIIAALVRLFIALFTIILTKSAKITGWMVTGLVLGLGAVCTIFYEYIGQLNNRYFILFISMALLSTLSWAFGTVYTSKNTLSIHILFGVVLQMLIGGFLMLAVCFITGKYVNLIQTPLRGGMPCSIYLLWIIAGLFSVCIRHP